MSICPKCNKRNNDENKYCIYCGFHIQAYEQNKSFFKKEYTRSFQLGNQFLYDTIIRRNDGIIVALLSKVAKASGRITKAQANFISNILNQLQNPNQKDIREVYKKIIENEKDNQDNIFELSVKLNSTMNYNEKANLIEVLIECALANGVLHPKEEAVITKIVLALNFDYEVYKDIFKSRLGEDKQAQNQDITSLKKAYEILKISKKVSDNEVKLAYRQLVAKFHPDKLASKDLDEDFVIFAENKMKDINFAYDIIKKDRGMK